MSSLIRQLNQQRFRRLHVVCGDKEVLIVAGDLHHVVALSQLLGLFVEHDTVFV